MTDYVLGYTDAEHERLGRQAAHFDPLTERLFRVAGVGPGMRVLDLGSGAGDVAMLAARLVGPAGEVVGVERDSHSIERARKRVEKAGVFNVTFLQSDIAEISNARPFDAAVGRWILMFVPDPAAVLRSVAALVRPGGVVAFQEPSWIAILRGCAHLPLCSASATLLRDTIRRSGGDTELGLSLRRVFEDAGLPAPHMHMDTPVGKDADLARWIADTLQSVRPRIREADPALRTIGDFDTLATRLHDEIAASTTALPWLSVVGAWTTK